MSDKSASYQLVYFLYMLLFTAILIFIFTTINRWRCTVMKYFEAPSLGVILNYELSPVTTPRPARMQSTHTYKSHHRRLIYGKINKCLFNFNY